MGSAFTAVGGERGRVPGDAPGMPERDGARGGAPGAAEHAGGAPAFYGFGSPPPGAAGVPYDTFCDAGSAYGCGDGVAQPDLMDENNVLRR